MITERGCRIISSTWSWFSLARGCRKNCLRFFSRARSIKVSTGSWFRSVAISSMERWGGIGLVHQEQPFEIRRPGFRTDPPGYHRLLVYGPPQPVCAGSRGSAGPLLSLRATSSSCERAPGRQPVERRIGLEGQDRIQRAAVHLKNMRPPAGCGFVRLNQDRAASSPAPGAG